MAGFAPLDVSPAVAVALRSVQAAVVLGSSFWLTMQIARRPLRGLDEAPWYVRARASWPLQTLVMFAYATSLGVLIARQYIMPSDGLRTTSGIAAACVFGAVIVTMTWAWRRTLKVVHGTAPTWRIMLRTTAFLWVVQWGLLPICFVAAVCCPPVLDVRAALIYCLTLAAALALNFGGSLWLMRRLGIAVPASPPVQQVLDGAATRCGFAPPPIYELDLSFANAWAFPTTGQVCVTRQLVNESDAEELESILLHEAAHLQESRGEIAKRLFTLPVVCGMALMPVFLGQYGTRGLYYFLAVMYVAMFLSRRVSRRLELQADAFSIRSILSLEVYARALEKLYRLNLAPPVIGRLAATHPDLYDRMLAAGVTPEYERPARPSRVRGLLTKLFYLVLLSVGLFVSEGVLHVIVRMLTSPAT